MGLLFRTIATLTTAATTTTATTTTSTVAATTIEAQRQQRPRLQQQQRSSKTRTTTAIQDEKKSCEQNCKKWKRHHRAYQLLIYQYFVRRVSIHICTYTQSNYLSVRLCIYFLPSTWLCISLCLYSSVTY